MEPFRHQRLGNVVVGMLAVLFLAPLFLPRFLPFPDVPVHAGQLFILMHSADSALRFPEFYDVTGWLHPATPHRLLLWPVAAILGPEPAYRVLLAATLAGVVAAAAWMLRRQGKSSWLALLCFPVLYSYPLVFGFATYSAACAVLLFLCIALEAWLEAPSSRRLAVVVALQLLVFLLHPQVFVYACVITLVLAALHAMATGTRPILLAPLLATLLPGVLLELLYISNQLVMTAPPDIQLPPVQQRLNTIPIYAGGFWENEVIAGCFYLAAFTVILAHVLAPPRAAAQDAAARAWNTRYLLIGALFVGASAVLPEVFRFQHYISSRMIPMALLLLPWMVPDSAAWRGRVVPALMTVVALGVGTNILLEVMLFDVQARPFERVMERMPAAARYRCLLNRAAVPALYRLPVFDGFCSYILMDKGGFAGPQWEHTGIRFRPPYQTNLDLPGDWSFQWQQHGDWYDYYITHASAPTEIDEGGPLAPLVELIAQEGPFRVYQRKGTFSVVTQQ